MIDELSLAISIVALGISIFATVAQYLDLFDRRRQRQLELEAKERIEFEVERFPIYSGTISEGGWGIRILNPNKIIEHCIVEVEYGGGLRVRLQVLDTNVYEAKIPLNGKVSFRVLKGIVPEGTTIVVKDRTKELRRQMATDAPLQNP